MSKIEVNTVEPQCGTTLTLGGSGDTVALGSGASQTGFGASGAVSWVTDSIKTATFTGVSGKGYFCNTTGGAFEIDLPAGTAGDIIAVNDYANTFDTYGLTVDPNGSEKINGGEGQIVLTTEGLTLTLVYIDSTRGWQAVQDSTESTAGSNYIVATGGTPTTCGDYKIHTFTGPGTFTVLGQAVSAPNRVVDYLVVGGGAAGGDGDDSSGGGGAGGFRLSNATGMPAPATSPLASPTAAPVTVTAYPITVGAGGAAATDSRGASGSPSIFSSITSAGGGGGGWRKGSCSGAERAGANGGSGGGGASSGSTTGAGGTGNTPPVSPAQGTDGGEGNSDNASWASAGGGGGAAAAGGCGGGSAPGGSGPGGAGSYVSPTMAGSTGTTGPVPSTRYFSGGGGGGNHPGTSGGATTGGSGGGGAGSASPGAAVAGTTNTGGAGGGGAGADNGAAGGSGIVIIRYKFQ